MNGTRQNINGITDEIRRIDNHLIYTPEHDAILRDIGIYCMSRARNDEQAADRMLMVLESLSLEHHELFKILYEGGKNGDNTEYISETNDGAISDKGTKISIQ